jgi:hypothetical protein
MQDVKIWRVIIILMKYNTSIWIKLSLGQCYHIFPNLQVLKCERPGCDFTTKWGNHLRTHQKIHSGDVYR